MKLMDVVTELTEVRDNENKTLHHGGRNRGEGLDLGILEMESRGGMPSGVKNPQTLGNKYLSKYWWQRKRNMWREYDSFSLEKEFFSNDSGGAVY